MTFVFRTFDYNGTELEFPATLEGLRELKIASDSLFGWGGCLTATDEDGALYDAYFVGVGPHWFYDYEIERKFDFGGGEVPVRFQEMFDSVFPNKFLPGSQKYWLSDRFEFEEDFGDEA
jgi:hypothetical protein